MEANLDWLRFSAENEELIMSRGSREAAKVAFLHQETKIADLKQELKIQEQMTKVCLRQIEQSDLCEQFFFNENLDLKQANVAFLCELADLNKGLEEKRDGKTNKAINGSKELTFQADRAD